MCNGFGHQLQLKVKETHGDELVDIITVVLVPLPIATREEGGWVLIYLVQQQDLSQWKKRQVQESHTKSMGKIIAGSAKNGVQQANAHYVMPWIFWPMNSNRGRGGVWLPFETTTRLQEHS